MAKINKNYNNLPPSYFFLEVGKKVSEFVKANPKAEILRLGVGNTTEALTPAVVKSMSDAVKKLSDRKTYTGYTDEQGESSLRQALANYYAKYGVLLDPQELFISDGAKPDCANILSVFDEKSVVAIADPVYPVYRDSSIISGRKVVYMPCTEENGFIPSLPKAKVDLIYICSPNNPTGAVFTKKTLADFVAYALKKKAVIIFDGAYAEYIKDPSLPHTIYEIKGAKECAIEINSFSKWAGFTGVRLGWSVVPMDLKVQGVQKGKINAIWNRRQTTMFNGASNIAQAGGLAVLSPAGQRECKALVDYYIGNAKIIREGLLKLGLKVYGGQNSPYLWVKTPNNMSSWDFFDKVLQEAHVVSIPGCGFGFLGEGYLRFSAYGYREDIQKAVISLEQNLKL